MSGTCCGILLVDKEEGLTSHQVVARVRRILGGRRGPKAGHAGTLDPFATGLVVVIVGQATKLSRYLAGEDKWYRAVMKIGEATDTLDLTGRIVKRAGPLPSREEITAVLGRFTGEVEQTPPMYSAVKHKGVRAYKLARKGIEVQLERRRVRIFDLELTDYDPPFAALQIHCSSGTYIRALAADVADAMGTVAHLTELRRLTVGRFDLSKAMKSADLQGNAVNREEILERLIRPADALDWMPSIVVPPSTAARIRRGQRPSIEEMGAAAREISRAGGGHAKVTACGELVALGVVSGGGDARAADFTVERVFLPEN